jgi:cytochrome P450
MRRIAPVWFDPHWGGWHVFGYADVQRVLGDWATFSSASGRDPDQVDPPDALGASLISIDPPRHRELRALVTQAFTPRAVEALGPTIQALSDALLDRVVDRGHMDLVHDFAIPLPVTVIASLLGIPAADRDRFKRWSDAVVTRTEPADYLASASEMSDYFLRLIDERRAAPGNDLVSALLVAESEGHRLRLVELLGFCVLLLVAGNETTTNLISNALLCLNEAPDAMAALRADLNLVPNALEEVLRYRSPVQSMFRSVLQPTAVGGSELRPGQPVVAWIGSANRDAAFFDAADRFDITRSPNRHLAFGQGPHFCLGAPLARLEGRIALTTLLRRLPDLQVAPGAALTAQESQIVYGVTSLPVVFGQQGA